MAVLAATESVGRRGNQPPVAGFFAAHPTPESGTKAGDAAAFRLHVPFTVPAAAHGIHRPACRFRLGDTRRPQPIVEFQAGSFRGTETARFKDTPNTTTGSIAGRTMAGHHPKSFIGIQVA